jgi:primase-polymerase (primpol)-like protein
MKTNEHLFHFLPFLRNDYRKLTKAETTSDDVFKELFPDEEIDLTKLEQIYAFQNIVTITEKPSEIVVDYSAGHIRKSLKNGKV